MGLFDAINTRRLDANTCFICGATLSASNRTDEHVIPKWLQNKFNLWERKITLLNKTTIPYRNLVIPCCNTCNNEYLSTLENKVRFAIEDGPKSVANLDNATLFVWLGKIFYGLLFREVSLLLDRSDPSLGTIVSEDTIRQYTMHHYFLQSVRVPITFVNFFPASIFVFELQSPQVISQQFDLKDDILSLTIFIRMANVGIIAALQDGGAQQIQGGEFFGKYKGVQLHPIQFEELGAHFFYSASLINRIPKYTIGEQEGKTVILQMPLVGLSNKPLFDEWQLSEYAKYLSLFVDAPINEIHPIPDKVMTWLHDEYSKDFRFIDLEYNPWRS